MVTVTKGLVTLMSGIVMFKTLTYMPVVENLMKTYATLMFFIALGLFIWSAEIFEALKKIGK